MDVRDLGGIEQTKVFDIKLGRLKWVLRTAMPLASEFRLFLNKEEIKSSKENMTKLFEFQASELPSDRIKGLNDKTKQNWTSKENSLVCSLFPNGIRGNLRFTRNRYPERVTISSRSNVTVR